MSLGAAAGGAVEGLQEILKARALKQIQDQQLQQQAFENQQSTARLGIDQQRADNEGLARQQAIQEKLSAGRDKAAAMTVGSLEPGKVVDGPDLSSILGTDQQGRLQPNRTLPSRNLITGITSPSDGVIRSMTLRPTTAERNAAVPKPPTESELDDAFQKLEAKRLSGVTLTGPEQNTYDAYKSRKLLTTDTSSAAATERQTATIAAAAAQQARAQRAQQDQQDRAQGFTERQAGRAELTNKVEQPYLDAQEKASTLRSVIDAAKNGNMAAANVQSLMGTLGLVTMEGVKRINTTELNQVAGAGSLFERLRSQLGGLTEGQSLSPKLQADLQELSDKLRQSARAKYLQGHQAVTTRYGLADEKPIPDTSAAPDGGQAPPAAVQRWGRDAAGRPVRLP